MKLIFIKIKTILEELQLNLQHKYINHLQITLNKNEVKKHTTN